MKVLIAEDDRLTREGLEQILRNEGYATLCARDGIHALDLFRAEAPDFVCLDIMMPRMNGYDVCREIRRENPDVPVVFISAKSEEIDTVIGLELGADDFISKPFGVREVVARVRAVTRRCLRAARKLEPCEPFEFGPYRVDPVELTATAADRTAELSLRDVGILRVLAEHKGEVVGRERLYRECWNLDRMPDSRTLDQHISKLRKRIEEDPANPALIRTVHGYGYRYGG